MQQGAFNSSQLRRKGPTARVQGSLHARTLTPQKIARKWERLGVSPRSLKRGDKGEEESSGGMGKSPLGLWKAADRVQGGVDA